VPRHSLFYNLNQSNVQITPSINATIIMDFSKLTQQASSFMNKQNSSSNQGSTDPNMNTNTGDMSNTGMADTNTDNSSEDYGDKGVHSIPRPIQSIHK
jgi:hypothetical protein